MVLVLDIVTLAPVKRETKKRKEIWNGFFPRISWCTLPSCINPLAWIIINPNLIPFGRTHKNYTLTAVSKRVVSSIFFIPHESKSKLLGFKKTYRDETAGIFVFSFKGAVMTQKFWVRSIQLLVSLLWWLLKLPSEQKNQSLASSYFLD